MWKKEYKPKHLTLNEIHLLWLMLKDCKSLDLIEVMDSVEWQNLWEVFYKEKRPDNNAMRYHIHKALEHCEYLQYVEVMNG